VDWHPVPALFTLGYRVLVKNSSFDKQTSWNRTFIYIAGLQSNATYVIKVYPVHGLMDKWSIAETSSNIEVTTKQEKGKMCGSIL